MVYDRRRETHPAGRDRLQHRAVPRCSAKGNWKLVWLALLPPNIELFDLSKDPSEKTNLADQNPDKVKELQAQILDLAKQAAPPLFLSELVRLELSAAPDIPDIGELDD